MRLIILISILFAGCGTNFEIINPEETEKTEFKLENWPCSMAVELVEKEPTPLYAIKISCQEAYDFRKMRRIGEAVDLTDEQIEHFFEENEITLVSTPEQIKKIIEEWIKEGGGQHD